MKLPIRTLLLATFLLTNALVHADQTQPQMTIYSGIPGADKILVGEYVEAINDMQKANTENPALFYNNLCVAYTLDKQIELARVSCEQALRETEVSKNFGLTWLERKYSSRTKKLYRDRARHHLSVLDSLTQQLAVSQQQ